MDTTAQRYSVREADLGADGEQLIRLWADNLLGLDDAAAKAKLEQSYRRNPVDGASVQLLEFAGEPQGAQGLNVRHFWRGEQRFRGVGFRDFVVNRGHRSLLPSLLLMRDCVRSATQRFDLAYGFPNDKAAGVCARGGLREFGSLRRYATPLSSRTFLARRMPGPLASAVATFVDTGLRAREHLHRRRENDRLDLRAVSWTDPLIDALWERRPRSLVFSERTSRILQWRFAASSQGQWRVHAAHGAGHEAQGYVIWRNHAGHAEVGDFFSTDPGRWTAPLLRAFVQVARAEGLRSVSVEFCGARVVTDQLLAAGLAIRPERRQMFISKRLPSALDTLDTWYVTGFDDDDDASR